MSNSSTADVWVHFENGWEAQGHTQIPNCIIRDQGLSAEAKFLYGLLKSYAWESLEAHPGRDRMCKDSGVSAPTLGKWLKELKDANLVDVKRRGLGKTNQYWFLDLKRRYGPEVKTGLHQERNPSLHKEDSVKENPIEEENAPKGAAGGEPAATEDEFQGWHIEERIRERLDSRGEPYTHQRLRRYTRWANALYRRSVSEQELYEAADRVASEWHRVKLTLEDALSDVQEGKQTNGRAPEAANPDKPRAAAWYASVYPVEFGEVCKWIEAGCTHSEIEKRLEASEAGAVA